MKKLAKISVGVDVSKDFLDVYLYPVKKSLKIGNSTQGLLTLLETLSYYDVKMVVCESSGGYECFLINTLREANYKIWQVDPKMIKGFIVSEGIKAKTDAIDAKMIALFAWEKNRNYEAEIPTTESLKLKELVIRKAELKHMITMEKLRLSNPMKNYTKASMKRLIAFMEKEIQKLEKQIDEMIDNNDHWKTKKQIMESVPGVGKATSSSLIAELPELGKIESKQITALIGLAPYVKQSGKYRGVAKIRDGRPAPRKAIYMAALTASRKNPVFKKFYDKLRENGKKPKVAIVAVMRKMIVTINAMVKRGEMWSPETI